MVAWPRPTVGARRCGETCLDVRPAAAGGEHREAVPDSAEHLEPRDQRADDGNARRLGRPAPLPNLEAAGLEPLDDMTDLLSDRLDGTRRCDAVEPDHIRGLSQDRRRVQLEAARQEWPPLRELLGTPPEVRLGVVDPSHHQECLEQLSERALHGIRRIEGRARAQ